MFQYCVHVCIQEYSQENMMTCIKRKFITNLSTVHAKLLPLNNIKLWVGLTQISYAGIGDVPAVAEVE